MRRFVLFGAGAALVACRAPTEITIDVTTDIPCARLLGTSIAVGSYEAIEGLPPATVTTECASDGHIGSIVVVPGGADDAQVAVRVIGGTGADVETCKSPDYAGCVVARRLLSFEPHDPLYLPILLRDACIGVPCTPTTTCVDGSCVDATVKKPVLCSNPTACGESVLGPGAPDGGAPDGGAPDGGARDRAVEVAASDGTSCARTMTGKIYCWGSNDSGKLGIGGGGSPGGGLPATQAMTGVTDPVGMGLASSFFCVLSGNGDVRCAGNGARGQLGNGGLGSSTTPSQVVLPMQALSLAVGANHACAGLSAHTLACWGAGTADQLGTASGTDTGKPGELGFSSSYTSLAIAAGGDTSCVLLSPGGVVQCWGSNQFGQLYAPTTTTMSAAPQNVPLSPLVATGVAVGSSAACALAGAQARCWGQADGATIMPPGLTPLDPLANIAQLALGGNGGCARLATGHVACWGANDAGQLGLGTTDTMNTFPPTETKPVSGITDAVYIARSSHHACAARASGKVSCWGDNTAGQVSGDGIPTPVEATPVDVLTLP